MPTKKLTLWAAAALLGLSSFSAQAAVIGLFDYGFNIDGTTSIPTMGDPLPAGVDLSNFNLTGEGLGTISATITGTGAHTFDAFFDHEIDEDINTFYNEFGTATNIGDLAAGQSWEIDEPGYVFGDIYSNFEAGSLDNTNAVPSTLPDDVSMAIGWDFSLLAGEEATINLTLSETMPTSGFFLSQTDPDSIAPASIYFSSSLTISGGAPGPGPIPEPSILLLFGIGMAGLLVSRRRFTKG